MGFVRSELVFGQQSCHSPKLEAGGKFGQLLVLLYEYFCLIDGIAVERKIVVEGVQRFENEWALVGIEG